MDFFSFIIIAVFVYGLFSKKDKPPRRGQRSAEDNRTSPQPRTQTRPMVRTSEPAPETQGRRKKEGLFESLERQIRESAEKLEQELQGGKTVLQKPSPAEVSGRRKEYRAPSTARRVKEHQSTEGVWGQEGYSEYDKYVSTQGTQGTEGLKGQEGTWGTEGSYYAEKERKRASAITQTEIGTGSVSPVYSEEERLVANLGFSPSQVVQGVIWAEILKEPRGKRALSRR